MPGFGPCWSFNIGGGNILHETLVRKQAMISKWVIGYVNVNLIHFYAVVRACLIFLFLGENELLEA